MSTSSGNGSGPDVELQQKKPRLLKQGNLAAWRKSPSPSSSLVQSDPRCLLVIGGDSLTHVLRYLAPRDVCKSEMSCKLMRQAAAPLVDGMIREMNATCDSVSVGHGSRTKLSRYLAAKKMSDRVRPYLAQHVVSSIRARIRNKICDCFACSSFPQKIDKSVFDTDGKDFEFFLCFYDTHTRKKYFQGFVPVEQPYSSSFEMSLFNLINKSNNWGGLKEIFTATIEYQRLDRPEWWQKWGNSGILSNLAVVAIAVHKERCEASFLGAAMEFGYFSYEDAGDDDTIGVISCHHVKCDVHRGRQCTAITEFHLEFDDNDGQENKLELSIVFYTGDRFQY